MMMRICCGTRLSGLRVVDGSCRFVSTTTSTSRSSCIALLGPPEIGHDLQVPGRSVQFTKPRFRLWGCSQPDYINEDYWRDLFRSCTWGWLQSHQNMNHALSQSWKGGPLNTLRVIGYMKQIRYWTTDASLSQRRNEQFYTAALWLHAHHPETLVRNVRAFSRMGSLRDFPEVLHRLVRGPFVRQAEKLERMRLRRQQSRRLMGIERWWLTKDDAQESDVEQFDVEQFDVFGSREEKRIQQARQAVEMYNSDPRYRSLHDAVSDLFAELLKSDLELLRSGELQKLSLASKWCPSLGSSYDRSTLLCEGIARRLFPYDGPSYRGIEDAHYAYRVRDRLRREVLVPLRRALELPEIYMSNKQWNLLPYDRVSPTAMKIYKRLFIKHDKSRFLQYVHANKRHKETFSSFPHEIHSLSDSAQWRRIVETFSEQGKFKNCVVTCDWSGNKYLPKPKLGWDFPLSFQLLASELSDDPWKGKFLRQTGGQLAEFVNIEVDELQSKMQCLEALAISSDDLRVWTLLDKILETAVCGKVSPENMVKRLCIISTSSCCDFIYRPQIEEAQRKFERCGYVMPDLLFWQMGGFCFKKFEEVCSIYDGVATHILGSSPSCFRVFMEKDGKLEEDTVMVSDISGAKYKQLKVFD